MALSATIRKAELQISDMDRQYYAEHALTLAQHPSETDQRLMARVLAFVLYAHPDLAFGRGLSTADEPDLWCHSPTGEIETWIELGQPDEARLRRACGRARQVVLLGYAGRASAVWWEKTGSSLARLANLTVLDLPAGAADAMAALVERTMRLQCLVQDGEVQLLSTTASVTVAPLLRQAATR